MLMIDSPSLNLKAINFAYALLTQNPSPTTSFISVIYLFKLASILLTLISLPIKLHLVTYIIAFPLPFKF